MNKKKQNLTLIKKKIKPQKTSNEYIYIYSHPQTDLFHSIRTHQCG